MKLERDRKWISDAAAETRAVYEELARRPIARQCTGRAECCQFHITGRTPFLTRGEALVMLRGWRATGRKEIPDSHDGTCPVLDRDTGRCRIYESRPFGCRTHFCAQAGGPYQRREVIDLIRRLEELDERLGGGGAREIASALAAVAHEF